MSGLDNLKTRLNYCGGNAERRLQKDKERSLKKALIYSYQAETAILSDGRMFRCLINTDRTKADYDCKIISIPYKDICLGRIDNKNGKEIIQIPNRKTSQGIEKIGMKCGDVFKWKETDTYWIVYLEKTEDAYFKAEIYKCEEEIIINNKKYHVYIRGPVETTIQWRGKSGINWNELNYSLIIYITKDKDTLDYFHRFKQLKIRGQTWEVKTVDPYSADGIIEVCLGEYFNNEFDDRYKEQEKKEIGQAHQPPAGNIYIKGPKIVHPYEKHKYIIYGLTEGEWDIDNPKKAAFKKKSYSTAIVDFITGKSGKIILRYKTNSDEVTLPIEIKSI